MARKYRAVLIIINLIFMFIVLSIPISILLAEYSRSGRIDKALTYTYSSATPPSKYELNLNADIGKIDVNYITEPVDYLVRIDVLLEMGGPDLNGKSYLDFFNVVWENESSHINFTLELKGGIDQDQVITLIEDVYITVTLKAGEIWDINISMKIQGDVRLTIPWRVSVGNILTNITKGDIQYEFNYGIVGGNITGIIQETGNIELITNEVEYIQNITWALYTYDGDISLQILQKTNMNANVSGIISTNYGNINFKYRDDNNNNGAYYTLHYNPDDLALPQVITQIVGFDSVADSEQPIFYLESYDYPAQNNYNLLFYNSNGLYLLLDLRST